ncbi:hypothetical protein K1X84_02265 [bacterium]|nr:hypothetical protein [bacterium]
MIPLSLREKIGQLIVPRLDFPSNDLSYAEKLIREFHIGSFILFGGESDTIADILNHVQSISRHPLLFSADLERGLGQQVRGATTFPYAMGLANAEQTMASSIRTAAAITAIESRAIGIHWNYAPVIDVNNNPDNPIINIRSFGHDLNQVIQYSTDYIRGLKENGMLSTAKHFPGHGDTTTDSHIALPRLDHSESRLRNFELLPFHHAVQQGVDAIMVGHIQAPALDQENWPASLSQRMVSIIRDEWRYEGLLVSDALMMGAIKENYSEEEAAIRAIQAGIDQLLIPIDTTRAFEIIEKAVLDGRLSEDRIDQSVCRIWNAKTKMNLIKNRQVDIKAAQAIVGCEAHQKEAQKIFSASISKDAWFGIDSSTDVWFILSAPNSLNRLRSELKLNFKIYETVLDDPLHEMPELRGRSLIVISDLRPMAWRNAISFPAAVQNILDLNFTSKRHLLISCGSPYLNSGLKELKNYICTYGDDGVIQELITQRLTQGA